MRRSAAVCGSMAHSSRSVKHGKRRVLAAAVLVAVAGCGTSPPTDPVEWLSTQAIPVRSVDPSDRDFSDLEAFRGVIGDSRMVLLGEQSHGDGTVFLAKTRLIEFLHQEMGFDVLAFESGMFGMKKAWEAMVEERDPGEAFSMGASGIWAGSAQVQPLIGYLGEVVSSDRPLELAGFDSQSASGSRESLVPELESFLAAERSPLLTDRRWPGIRLTFAGVLDSSHYIEKPSEEDKQHFRQVMTELRAWVGGDPW